MRRDTLVQLGCVGAIGVGLVASTALSSGLAWSVGRNKLGYTDRAEDGDPPQVALGIAMGAFRGLFVNWLWIRANALKEEGKFHESIQLASAITRLQPRFPQVWTFHAWNMAYNISVSTNTFEERWQWVKAGIELLRDEGIPANPNDLLIHKELAWIFLHKVQGYTDDANVYYKQMLAREWSEVLGDPPAPDPRSRDRDLTIQRYVDWLTPVAEAPPSFESLAEQNPGAAALVERIRKEVGLDPLAGLREMRGALIAFAQGSAVARSHERALILAGMRERNRAMLALVMDPGLADAWSGLLAFLRRRVLIDEYRMDPERMIRFTRKYGPLDWRHPAAHALYWSARGSEEAHGRATELNERDFDFINTDRVTIQAVQELWRSGELYYDLFTVEGAAEPLYVAMPNVHFVKTYGDILGELVARSWADRAERVYSFYAAGYENFLIDAVRFYYRRGQKDEAARWYDVLRTYPGQNLNDPERADRFSRPLDEFVWAEVQDRFTVPDVARSEVVGALQGAFVAGLLAGDDQLFREQFEYANAAHRFFFEQQRRISAMSPEQSRMDQLDPRFPVEAGRVLAQVVGILDLDDAETVYTRAPEDLRPFAYDALLKIYKPRMDEMARDGGRPFAQVFPEPPGFAAYQEWLKEEMIRQEARRPQVQEK